MRLEPGVARFLQPLPNAVARADLGLPGRLNNFDLIRLCAALQVMFLHGVEHLNVNSLHEFSTFLGYFPGVPVFFVTSGFLISMSWDRSPSLRQYSINRFLRIYPALWVCLAVSISLFLLCGVRVDSTAQFLIWAAAQITFGQFYNPDFLRGFGVGSLNGSLWTIVVEIQFYMVLPVLALVAKYRPQRWAVLTLIAMLVMIATRALFPLHDRTIFQKLVGVTIFPYLFYFLVGVSARVLYEWRPECVRGRALQWTVTYGVWIIVETLFGVTGQQGNQLNELSIILLGMMTVSVAFTLPALSSRLLHENDVSYGVYIYHMPLVNLLLYSRIDGGVGLALLAIGVVVCAWLSWRLVERPALALKKNSLRRGA